MAAFRAVVKHRLDAPREEIVAALKEGLTMIAMELVGEHGLSLAEVESALEEAQSCAEHEAEMQRHRDESEEG